jgi:hypothetical protein
MPDYNPWGHSKRNPLFTPLLSLLYHFTMVTPPPNREELPLFHSSTSLSPMEI